MMPEAPFVLHPIVAQEVGLLHLQLAMANQRAAELQAELDALKAGHSTAEPGVLPRGEVHPRQDVYHRPKGHPVAADAESA